MSETTVIELDAKRKRKGGANGPGSGGGSPPPTGDNIANPALQNDGNGSPYATEANALTIMKIDPRLAGLMQFNDFNLCHELTRAPPICGVGVQEAAGPYPRLLDAQDVTRINAYFQRHWSYRYKEQAIERVLLVEAKDNRCHPIRQYLSGLSWDGTPRLDRWLIHVFGVEDTPYHRAIAAKTLMAAVRRVRQPGCKFDHVLVLESPQQGIGKSSAIKILFGEQWFADQYADISSKDFSMGLQSKWVLEFPEIDTLTTRHDAPVIKQVITRSEDHYRPPYERNFRDVPRQGIFIGTTNRDDYLTDPTGNRRFWPVTCRSVDQADLEWLRENRDQIWGEAVTLEPTAKLYLEDDTTRQVAEVEQKNRVSEDALFPKVVQILDSTMYSDITVAEVLTELGFGNDKFRKPDQMRIAAMIKDCGWTKSTRHSSRHRCTLSIWDRPSGGG